MRALPARGEVHVWFGECDHSDSTGDLSLLSREEKIRCARMSCVNDRRAYASARAGARRVLAGYFRVSPLRIGISPVTRTSASRLTVDVMGVVYPVVVDIAQSQDRWLFGVTTDHPIGLALEHVQEKVSEKELEGFLSPAERDQVLGLTELARGAAFARMRVQKEAVIKAMGAKLRLPPHEVLVHEDHSGSWWVQPYELREPSATYTVQDLPAHGPALGALTQLADNFGPVHCYGSVKMVIPAARR